MKSKQMPVCRKKTTIGGQAIIEGIVMKGPQRTCVVVRRPDGAVKTVRSGEVSVRGLYGYTE